MSSGKQTGRDAGGVAGPWRHDSGELRFPVWLGDGRGAGGLVLTRGRAGWTVVARGVQRFVADGQSYAVVADLPIAGDVTRRMQASRGVTLTDFRATTIADGSAAVPAGAASDAVRVSFGTPARSAAPTLDLPSVAYVDVLDWSTGEQGRGAVGFRVHPVVFYRQLAEGGDVSLASVFLLGLMAIGVMFLTIEAVALVMGFALAKSITGAVHELFAGTERVRRGDLTHRIRVDTEDQLGELAESFNAMTGSIAGPADPGRGEAAPRGGAADRAGHPDVATARGAGLRAGPGGDRGLPSRPGRSAATTTTSSGWTSIGWGCWWPTSPGRARPRRSTWPSSRAWCCR